jgi:hypothetical protein
MNDNDDYTVYEVGSAQPQPNESIDHENAEKLSNFQHNWNESNNEAFVSVILKERDRVVLDEKIAGKFFVSEFSDFDSLLDKIGVDYGHGKYKFSLYENGKIKTYKFFNVAKPKTATENVTKAVNMNGDLKDVLAMVMQQQQQTQELIINMSRQQQQQPQQQESRADMLKEMMMMKQLFSTPQQQGGGMGDTLDMIERLKKTGLVSIGNQPDGGDDDAGFSKLLTTFAPVVEQVMSQQPVTQQESAPQQVQQPTPEQVEILRRKQAAENEIKKQQTQQQEKNKMNAIQKAMIKAQLNGLIKSAQRDADPYDSAQMIVDMVGEDKAISFIGNENAINEIMTLDPRANEPKIKAWLLDLAEYVKGTCGVPCKFDSEFLNDDDNTNENDTERGNTANAGNPETNDANHQGGEKIAESSSAGVKAG